jgi:hypothetical protein
MPKFSYSARPAKGIERRMIVEACRRLNAVASLHTYRYVGFGGIEFLDFDLIHRVLGIRIMTSIEKDLEWPERYKFNRPFRTITVVTGRASENLSALDWDGLRIVWLDYEWQLKGEVIRDCETVVRLLQPGSLLVVTVQARGEFSGGVGKKLEDLKANVPEDRIPLGITEESLEGKWGFAKVQRRILTEAVNEVVDRRGDGARLRQVFNFFYTDNVRMQTLGWVVSSAGLDRTVDACGFEELDFVRTGDEPMIIDVPILTDRELQHLNQKLPLKNRARLRERWLDRGVQEKYSELYRWYSDQP